MPSTSTAAAPQAAAPASLRERDVEQAIIDGLETFLLEMGNGFCFVGRQMRLTVEGDHVYVDLVFYNRLLRCFVLVDLSDKPSAFRPTD